MKFCRERVILRPSWRDGAARRGPLSWACGHGGLGPSSGPQDPGSCKSYAAARAVADGLPQRHWRSERSRARFLRNPSFNPRVAGVVVAPTEVGVRALSEDRVVGMVRVVEDKVPGRPEMALDRVGPRPPHRRNVQKPGNAT